MRPPCVYLQSMGRREHLFAFDAWEDIPQSTGGTVAPTGASHEEVIVQVRMGSARQQVLAKSEEFLGGGRTAGR